MNGDSSYDFYGTGDVTTWEELFTQLGWDADFAGDYDTDEMFQYLEDNPWLQWGQTEEEWLDPENQAAWDEGGSTFGSPWYWEYEELEGDDVYADLEDILYDIYGDDVHHVYDTMFWDLDPGTSGQIFDQYMDPYFRYDKDTGEFVSRYDPIEYEEEERGRFKLGTQRIQQDLEGALGKYRAGYKGLGEVDLDLSEIAGLASSDIAQVSEEYRAGVSGSESAYLDDLYAALESMGIESTAFTGNID